MLKINKLKVVGTPLGNLEDITLRALGALKKAELIICEDTRVTSRLLKKLDIPKPRLLSYRTQNHDKMVPKIKELLSSGLKTVLVCDAGMPSISDPGQMLIARLLEDGFEIDVIPGSTAFTTAAIYSGLPTDNLSFHGFFPRKRGKINKYWEISWYSKDLINSTHIAYEAPFRIKKTLQYLFDFYQDAQKSIKKQDIRENGVTNTSLFETSSPKVKKFLQDLEKHEINEKQKKETKDDVLTIVVVRELTKLNQEKYQVTLTNKLSTSKINFENFVSLITEKGEFVVLWRWL